MILVILQKKRESALVDSMIGWACEVSYEHHNKVRQVEHSSSSPAYIMIGSETESDRAATLSIHCDRDQSKHGDCLIYILPTLELLTRVNAACLRCAAAD